jgi:hypothetical protein
MQQALAMQASEREVQTTPVTSASAAVLSLKSDRSPVAADWVARRPAAFAHEHAEIEPKVQVALVGTEATCRVFANALLARSPLRLELHLISGGPDSPRLRDGITVTIIRLGRHQLEALSWGIAAQEQLGYPELVFVVDSLDDPAAQCLRACGVQRIFTEAGCCEWLGKTGHLLAEIARGRRAQRTLASLPLPPPEQPAAFEAPLPALFEAEQRFREAYVRRLMASGCSRKEAAARAGVPYRTLCSILATIGL